MNAESPPRPPAPLRFVKMHGAGNDFVILDADGLRAGGLEPAAIPALARRLGDRHRGVGFDQLALWAREGEGLAMRFWNPDGSEAAACGNATRCVARLAMEATGATALDIRTGRGTLRAEATPDGRIRVNMGPPVEDWRAIPLARAVPLDALPVAGSPSAVGMGNPHCVLIVEDAEAAPVTETGPRLERDPLFPEGTNVEFVEVIDRATIRMRVWERGLGITLACGSGACAAAVATARRGLTERAVTVRLDGGDLEIDWRPDGVWMTGPTARVFEGELSPEVLAGASLAP